MSQICWATDSEVMEMGVGMGMAAGKPLDEALVSHHTAHTTHYVLHPTHHTGLGAAESRWPRAPSVHFASILTVACYLCVTFCRRLRAEGSDVAMGWRDFTATLLLQQHLTFSFRYQSHCMTAQSAQPFNQSISPAKHLYNAFFITSPTFEMKGFQYLLHIHTTFPNLLCKFRYYYLIKTPYVQCTCFCSKYVKCVPLHSIPRPPSFPFRAWFPYSFILQQQNAAHHTPHTVITESRTSIAQERRVVKYRLSDWMGCILECFYFCRYSDIWLLTAESRPLPLPCRILPHLTLPCTITCESEQGDQSAVLWITPLPQLESSLRCPAVGTDIVRHSDI